MRLSNPSGDTGEAPQAVTAALSAYADGTGSEHAALTAIAASRLLVPVVAVLAEASESGAREAQEVWGDAQSPHARGDSGGSAPTSTTSPKAAGGSGGSPPRDNTEMALPTLIGNDGRRAVIAFTGTETLRRWKEDARPVPVPAPTLWPAALSEADAVVIDVAGPVPLVVEGARLRALANGQPPPLPHEDPDIRAEVAAVTSEFTLEPGGGGADLAVTLKTGDMDKARQAAEQIAIRLSARFRRGIEIRTFLSRTEKSPGWGSEGSGGSGGSSPRGSRLSRTHAADSATPALLSCRQNQPGFPVGETSRQPAGRGRLPRACSP